MATEKIVYITGAGFSYSGGFPLQAQILKKASEYKFDILSGKNNDVFEGLANIFLPAKEAYKYTPDRDAYTYVPPSSATLNSFLTRVFSSNINSSLEDIFTLLDQSITKRSYCLGYSWTDLELIRTSLKRAILTIFHDVTEGLKNKRFYHSVAAYLLEQRIKAGKKGDSFSIISLNWDSLLEDSIYWCIEKTKGYKKADIDYCTYTFPLVNSSAHTTSVLQKAKNIYNIKMLKLHGSTNWLLCPNCNRLYTGVGSKESVWDLYVKAHQCEKCSKVGDENNRNLPTLEPFFITPTFTKVFDNTHIQSIWDNAYIELSEAKTVVFIGYSLPEADYHFRTLLRRSVHPKANIEVVLTSKDFPSKRTPMRLKRYLAASRYNDFFGKKRIKLYSYGMNRYFNRVVKVESLENKIRTLARLLNKK